MVRRPGITRVTRVVTDNGNPYRSAVFNRSLQGWATTRQFIRPYTPRHNGKVERYNRIQAEEVLYARPYASEEDRTRAIQRWIIHYTYHRPHTACRDQPPTSRLPEGVDNVMRNYS